MSGGNEEDIGSYRGQPIWGAGRHSAPNEGGDTRVPSSGFSPVTPQPPLGGPRAGWLADLSSNHLSYKRQLVKAHLAQLFI